MEETLVEFSSKVEADRTSDREELQEFAEKTEGRFQSIEGKLDLLIKALNAKDNLAAGEGSSTNGGGNPQIRAEDGAPGGREPSAINQWVGRSARSRLENRRTNVRTIRTNNPKCRCFLMRKLLVGSLSANKAFLEGFCRLPTPKNACNIMKYVFARPAGKRCLVVSSNGSTVSRLRNGSMLHHFPSSLPNGAWVKGISAPSHVYCILDCIFHEPDQTYYVIDMICWRGYSLYGCSAEFRFFWLNSKLTETGACDLPSAYHKYRFSVVPVYDSNQIGLQTAYTCRVPFVKDGLLFYNRHAHYQTGNTPLSLVWKDELCSQYVLDTDSKGQVPAQQQVVLELQDDGKLTTYDDPPILFGCLEREFLQKLGLQAGNLLRFSIVDESVRIVDGKLELGEIKFVSKTSRSRVFADSYSKVFFQYSARHSPLQFMDLIASSDPNHFANIESNDIEMIC